MARQLDSRTNSGRRSSASGCPTLGANGIEPERTNNLANLGALRQKTHATPEMVVSTRKLDEPDARESGRCTLPVVQGHQPGSSPIECGGDM